MKRTAFPFLALSIGGLLMAVLLLAGSPADAAQRRLPLLMLLMISEFGMFVTAFGAWSGVRGLLDGRAGRIMLPVVLGCVVLAGAFLWLGFRYWPL